MIELYVLLTLVNGNPKLESFQDIQQACNAFESASSASPRIYKESLDRKDNATFSEGDCKPLKQFVTK